MTRFQIWQLDTIHILINPVHTHKYDSEFCPIASWTSIYAVLHPWRRKQREPSFPFHIRLSPCLPLNFQYACVTRPANKFMVLLRHILFIFYRWCFYVQDVNNISPKTNLEQVGYKLYIARIIRTL